MKFNATELLKSSEGFIPKITPNSNDTKYLKQARKLIRDSIKQTFDLISNALNQDHLGKWLINEESIPYCYIEAIRKLQTDQKEALKKVQPKFLSQGSCVYKTMNTPCHQPPQQIDLDDGVYLPIDMMRDGPIIGKNLFFIIIDNTLNQLAKKNDWRFIGDKPTCSRLVIRKDMHIDVPLYAIPREKYQAILNEINESGIVLESIDYYKEISKKYLDKDEVYLAMRNEEHWVKSDPSQISIWFQKAVYEHGEILRRTCRYLKAWRDHVFKNGGPSSITLMACAVNTFDNTAHEFKNDSEAFFFCAQNLHDQLRSRVDSPVDKEEAPLFPRKQMSEEEIKKIIDKSEEFARLVKLSLLTADRKETVIKYLRDIFGDRLPNRIDLISEEPVHSVLLKPAIPQAQEIVPNIKAG